jgi:hypothetical protein
MLTRFRLQAMCVLAVVIGVSSMLSVHSARSASQGRFAASLRVKTTLGGKKVLPHRIRWTARPSAAASGVTAVTFLIDGKVRWIEENPPYTYGGEGNWLVTSWLSPGVHRFSVRVAATGGRKRTVTTAARVVAPPALPADLDGTEWTRTYTQAEAGEAPAGTWTLSIDPTGWRIKDPEGTGAYIDVAYLGMALVETRGGIWTRPRNPYEGQAWCEDQNAPARFGWRVEGGSLTFTFIPPSNCDGFGSFMSKTWSSSG